MRAKIDHIVSGEIGRANAIHKVMGKEIVIPDKLTCKQCGKVFKPYPPTFRHYAIRNSSELCGPRCRQLWHKGRKK